MHNDPVNAVDPLGLSDEDTNKEPCKDANGDVIVCGGGGSGDGGSTGTGFGVNGGWGPGGNPYDASIGDIGTIMSMLSGATASRAFWGNDWYSLPQMGGPFGQAEAVYDQMVGDTIQAWLEEQKKKDAPPPENLIPPTTCGINIGGEVSLGAIWGTWPGGCTKSDQFAILPEPGQVGSCVTTPSGNQCFQFTTENGCSTMLCPGNYRPISKDCRYFQARFPINDRVLARIDQESSMLSVREWVIWMILSSTAAFCVPHSEVRLTDDSPPDSPVKLSGISTFDDEPAGRFRYKYRTTTYVDNVSQKSVLLLVAKLRFTGTGQFDLDNTREEDYFFAEDLLESGKAQTLKDSFGPVGAPQAKITLDPTDPQATATVLFVQFIDGSTWGDLEAGKHMLETRRLTWEKLQSLAETYRAKGEERFLLEFTRHSDLPAVGSMQRTYESTKDSTAVIARIRNMLRYADMHAKEAAIPAVGSGHTLHKSKAKT